MQSTWSIWNTLRDWGAFTTAHILIMSITFGPLVAIAFLIWVCYNLL